MALISCKDCDNPVSTEAAACPHCGAPQQRSAPPLLPVQPKEATIYSDNVVAVTNSRVIISGTTYVLRNITSVRMAFTPPRIVGAILLLIVGLFILLIALISFNGNTPAPVGVYIIAGAMIVGAILWMFTAKTVFHVDLSSASGQTHVLTSNRKDYIERVILSINEAIAKHHKHGTNTHET